MPSHNRLLGLAGALVIGAGVALQSRVNGALGERLGDGIAAAVWSFGSGLILLCGIALASRRVRSGLSAIRRSELRWWQCIGGLGGAFFVACQGLTIVTIGVALFIIAAVGGQIVSSIVVDRLGLGPAGRVSITVARIAGAALAIGAIGLAMFDEFASSSGDLVLAVLPFLAGLALAWQQAVNGRVGVVAGPLGAAWLNFAVGTVVLLAVFAVALPFRGAPATPPAEPWLYIGGTIGVVFIALAVVVVRWIGVLLLGLGAVAGQLAAAVLLDWLAPTDNPLTPTVVLGCLLALVAVAVAGSPGFSRTSRWFESIEQT